MAGEGVDAYRVIWESEPWPNLAVSVHPRVPKEQAEAVRKTLLDMKNDPDGQALISALKTKSFQGFDPVKDSDYDPLRKLYKRNSCADLGP